MNHMNNLSKKIIPLLLLLVCTGLLGMLLRTTQEATLFYREQQQVFLFDTDYVLNILLTIGGFATVCAQFIIQFFKIPGVGVWITALIGGLSAGLFWLGLRKIQPSPYLLPLAFLPIAFQCLYLMSHSYHYEGLIALLFWASALCIYSYSAQKLPETFRSGLGCLLAVGLFYGAGSIALLFTLSILCLDIARKDKHWFVSLIPLLLVLIIGSLTVLAGKKPDYDHVFWQKDYVEYFVELTPFYSLSWQTALLVIPLFFLSRYLNETKAFVKALLSIALLTIASVYFVRTAASRQEKDFYTLLRMFHYIDTEQWDAITSYKELNLQNYLHLNCLNLALSHQGRLRTDLFKYPQNGIQSLLSKYQAHIEESILFSHIYYHTGITSLAYDLAFGSSVGITYGNPTMTKILIKSHLIYGYYAAAEKFISLLEKTWAYREWAASQRKFLYNDEAVENDPELGSRRRSLTDNKDLFANILSLYDNLTLILEANPRNEAALDYAISTLLLSKNMPAIKAFVEKYYGTETLPALPELLQQAVISYAEHDPEYCRQHGVTDKLLSEFSLFKQRILGLRRARKDIASGIADYRHTFWYYLILTK